MAMFSESGLTAAGEVMCPRCKTKMNHHKDNFYECSSCRWQFWPNEVKVTCPVCGRPMKLDQGLQCYKCTGCASELWPPEDEDGNTEEEEPEYRRGSYAGLGLVYAGEIHRGNGRSKNSSGRKRKKLKTGPRVISQRYILD